MYFPYCECYQWCLKPPFQKQAQRSEEEHHELHDICCAWLWARKKMETEFTKDVIDRYTGLFFDGFLAQENLVIWFWCLSFIPRNGLFFFS